MIEQLLKLANGLLGQYGPTVALLVMLFVGMFAATVRLVTNRLNTLDKQRTAEINQYIKVIEAADQRYVAIVEKTEERYASLIREVLARRD